MRIVLGVFSMLIALAVVAVLARQQLRAVGAAATPGLVTAPAASAVPATQSRALQQQVQQDLERALQQAPARASAADQ
jgi:hypothetical protein